MPRIRTIKPESSFNEKLFDMELETGLPFRFVWAVLPCHCDREGRFEYRVRALKAQLLPYDEIDFSRVMDALWTRGFIEKYEVSGRVYGLIPSFLQHQVVNNREAASILPEPNKNNILACEGRVTDARATREVQGQEERKGREGKGKEGRVIAERVIDHLNKATGRNYKPVASAVTLITARLSEGFSEKDIQSVINLKTADWKNDKKMAEYLRPETLFNATKFNSYFGALDTKKTGVQW